MVYPGDYSRGAKFQNGYLILFQWYKRRNKHDKNNSVPKRYIIQKMLILSMESLFSKQTLRYQVFAYSINPSPPKIWLSILPSSYNTFPSKIDYVNLVFNQLKVINCTWWVWVFSLPVCYYDVWILWGEVTC